jgi:hypothetical protein
VAGLRGFGRFDSKKEEMMRDGFLDEHGADRETTHMDVAFRLVV